MYVALPGGAKSFDKIAVEEGTKFASPFLYRGTLFVSVCNVTRTRCAVASEKEIGSHYVAEKPKLVNHIIGI